MATLWHWSQGDSGIESTAILERETEDDVFVPEDLTGTTVTLSLFRTNGSTYKSGATVRVITPAEGRIGYTRTQADTQQGALTGKFCVTYADGSKANFPNTGQFSIRVSR